MKSDEVRRVCIIVLKCSVDDEASRAELERALRILKRLEHWEFEKISVLTR